MNPEAEANLARLRATFENREAICIEKGAIRVRLSNIRGSVAEYEVSADVEEIPTPGLGVGLFASDPESPQPPRRWQISGGPLTSFNEEQWTMGYGSWTFYIGAELVRGVCEMAAQFPETLRSHHRYYQITDFIQGLPGSVHATTTKVFPDGEEYLESQRRSYRSTSLDDSQPPDELEPAGAELQELASLPRVHIGLVRHFPVTEPWPRGRVTSDDLQRWRVRYEAAEPIVGPIDVSAVKWQRCLSSDLRRAAVTARTAYAGTITETPLLREADVPALPTGNLRLPVWGWRILLRFAWFTGHKSQRAARDEFYARIKAIADLLELEPVDTLVVSHAGVMFFLRKELLRRGFTGPKFGLAKPAELYVFARP